MDYLDWLWKSARFSAYGWTGAVFCAWPFALAERRQGRLPIRAAEWVGVAMGGVVDVAGHSAWPAGSAEGEACLKLRAGLGSSVPPQGIAGLRLLSRRLG
jgi:hypothetical protein